MDALCARVMAMGPEEMVLVDDGIQIVGGFGADGNGDRLREVLKTRIFGALPLLKGPLKGYWLYYDDDAVPEPPAHPGQSLNKLATALLGDQVCGGKLYGPVLVFRMET